MIFREAHINDIKQIMTVRFAVKENILSSPALVTDKDCEEYITVRGKGWVCETDNTITGFAIADLQENSIWALFVHPDYEKKGIGKKLHDDMLDWYFSKTKETVWLTTAPGTRAETFYRKSGWKEKSRKPNGEIKFELTIDDWENKKY
jgi:GNAT superfamily N-acetyltransferase